jgi:hypothetical protein
VPFFHNLLDPLVGETRYTSHVPVGFAGRDRISDRGVPLFSSKVKLSLRLSDSPQISLSHRARLVLRGTVGPY